MPYPVNLDCFNFDTSDITASANRILYTLNYDKLFRNQRYSTNLNKNNHLRSTEKRDTAKVFIQKRIKNKSK